MMNNFITQETFVDIEATNTGWDIYYDMIVKLKVPDGCGIHNGDKVKVEYKITKL